MYKSNLVDIQLVPGTKDIASTIPPGFHIQFRITRFAYGFPAICQSNSHGLTYQDMIVIAWCCIPVIEFVSISQQVGDISMEYLHSDLV